MSNVRTPDQQFAHYVKVAIVLFICCFSYFIMADIYVPLTPQARVYHKVTQITPRISGEIIEVAVHNNETVSKGQLLLQIDPRPYQLAVQNAELALAQVQQQNLQLDAEIEVIQADLLAAHAQLNEQTKLQQRSERLVSDNSISIQEIDRINASVVTANAQVQSLKAKLHAARIKRGSGNEHNVALQQAKNLLEQAKLELSYTQVVAPHDGIVSNLQIMPGTFAKAGTALTSLVGQELDLAADFREKSLYYAEVGSQALVTFDALPGQIFSAHIREFSAGISEGQLNANGNLVQVENSSRWVRDAQRLRVYLRLNDEPEQLLSSGARATVQILPDNGPGALMARGQIRLISWMHYIY
ncbi:HlyD family secretion protein [Oceanospirillum sediminis]|uniref:HlyD family secretion protein n=1 Tax=Oceanospirillum sediminis TaxID=2760088 RepID=A0A839ITT2_9GAMM|nr:HlyD family secretion protein [Oceanospirillum sediminis]MBB1487526.1 HlyD family secretion protein [Oceanospirillum sediminis]